MYRVVRLSRLNLPTHYIRTQVPRRLLFTASASATTLHPLDPLHPADRNTPLPRSPPLPLIKQRRRHVPASPSPFQHICEHCNTMAINDALKTSPKLL